MYKSQSSSLTIDRRMKHLNRYRPKALSLNHPIGRPLEACSPTAYHSEFNHDCHVNYFLLLARMFVGPSVVRLSHAKITLLGTRRAVLYHSSTTWSANKWKDVEVPIGQEKWIDVTTVTKQVESTPKSMQNSPSDLQWLQYIVLLLTCLRSKRNTLEFTCRRKF